MEGLTFRRATQADTERIAEIIYADPPEAWYRGWALGRLDRMRAIGRAMMRTSASPQGWQHTVLAELDGHAVGVLQSGGTPARLRVTAALALQALRIFGPWGLLRLAMRMRTLLRIQMAHPADSYHISELHVDPHYRNRGIGGALLRLAEEKARSGGHRLMSLQTETTNPARRLYERAGFRIVETRTDPHYERLTGAAGRCLMVKELT